MPNNRNSIGVFALIVVLTAAFTAPAAAMFFGCNDTRGQVLYTYSGSPGEYGNRSSSRRATHEYAQPRRHYSRPRATYYSSRRYANDRSPW